MAKPEGCCYPVGMIDDAVPSRFAGLVTGQGVNYLRFHGIRHGATSRLFENGLNSMQVAAITGHKTLQVIKHYTHMRAKMLG